MVGTAITLAIADGTKPAGEAAEVFYHDSWAEGIFSRQAKLEWLIMGPTQEHNKMPLPFSVAFWTI